MLWARFTAAWRGTDPGEAVSATRALTYATIREALLRGSKPISLQKAGLRVMVRPAEVARKLAVILHRM